MMIFLRRHTHAHTQKGFTIVELMIATLVFSTVLTLITVGVLYFTNMYYKGANLTNAQRTVRLITDDISQAIQFSNSGVFWGHTADAQPISVLCIGSRRYSYMPGRIVTSDGNPYVSGDTAGYHGLVADTVSAGCASADTAVSGFESKALSGSQPLELLGNRFRLTDLEVNPKSNHTYEIKVSVAYGDKDLLKNGATTGYDVQCESTTGSQYCATAKLTTIVQKRLQ